MSWEAIVILLAVLFIAGIFHLVTRFYYIVIPAGVIIFLIILWRNERNRRRHEAERLERERLWEITQKERAMRLQQENEEKERKRIEQDKALQRAEKNGQEVCWNCRTINPKRCDCGKCISSYKCHEEWKSAYECKECYLNRKIRECRKAEATGKDVCWDCLTINPPRCATCGGSKPNCLNCHGDSGGGVCNTACSSDD